MQEIGTWSTSEGTVSATLTFESAMPDDVSGQELPGWVSGALSGALGGASVGAAGGPWGLIAGAATGAVLGGATAAAAPQAPATPPAPGTASPKPAPPQAGSPGGGAQNTAAIQALQQFAAAIPALIQAVAASNVAKAGKPAELGDAEEFAEFVSEENLAIDEWTMASEDEGVWTIP